MITQVFTLARRPEGMPVEADFQLSTEEVPEITSGQILLKTLYISVDPYLRGKMNGTKQPRFELGEAITSKLIAEVIESKHPGFQVGEYISHYLPWKEYNISDGAGLAKIPHDAKLTKAAGHTNDSTSVGTSLTAWLGVLGVTGLSAYFALKDIGQPKPGETLVVSGAGGAVGSIAGQIGKIMGCRVVGIVGTEDKAKMITEQFGFDAAINYKTENVAEAIARNCPNGVDIYFDNVGGAVSDAVLPYMNPYGRIPVCGTIADYNTAGLSQGLAILPLVVYKFLRIQGFLIGDFKPRFDEGLSQLQQWIANDQLRYAETIVEGFQNLPAAFIGLFEGRNEGKMIVKV